MLNARERVAAMRADIATTGHRHHAGGRIRNRPPSARTAGDEAVSGGSGGAGAIERGGFRDDYSWRTLVDEVLPNDRWVG